MGLGVFPGLDDGATEVLGLLHFVLNVGRNYIPYLVSLVLQVTVQRPDLR